MPLEPETLARACAGLVDKTLGEDIRVLHVELLTTLTDYFVIASARNVRQLKAMVREIETGAKALGGKCLGMEGTPESGWMLVDLGDVVVHLFDAPTRSLFDLELLWGDAAVLDWQEAERTPE